MERPSAKHYKTDLELRYSMLDVTMPESHVLTLNEASALLHTSTKTMQRLIVAGDIRGFKIPNTYRGRWRISEKAIAEYIKTREEPTP